MFPQHSGARQSYNPWSYGAANYQRCKGFFLQNKSVELARNYENDATFGSLDCLLCELLFDMSMAYISSTRFISHVQKRASILFPDCGLWQAGLVRTLNTRTSVFGVTNPKGQYDPYQCMHVHHVVLLQTIHILSPDLLITLNSTPIESNDVQVLLHWTAVVDSFHSQLLEFI